MKYAYLLGLLLVVSSPFLPSQVHAQLNINEGKISRIGNGRYTSIPFTYLKYGNRNSCPVIEVTLNGEKKAVPFLLDTGTTSTTIRQSLADRLRLSVREIATTSVIGNRKKKVKAATIDTIMVGDFPWELGVVVLQDKDLATITDIRPDIGGIIGMNVLNDYAVYIDHTKRVVWLVDAGYKSSELRDALSLQSATVIDLGGNKARSLVSVSVEGEGKLMLLADTGCETTWIAREAIDHQKVPFILYPSSVDHENISLGRASLYQGRGVAHLRNSPAFAINPWFVSSATLPNSEWHGLLGSDFLSKYDVVYDFPNKMMYIQERSSRTMTKETPLPLIPAPMQSLKP